MLFIFFVSSAAGVLLGGVVGDKIGRYNIIWISILGPLSAYTSVAPCGLLLDRGSHDPDQLDHGQRLRIYHDLRHGVRIAPRRPGRWAILWAQLRDGGESAQKLCFACQYVI